MQRVFERLRENGDIYLGKYEGWYCVDDETFWLESKLVDGRCPTCGREVQWISEDDWFFRLSKYRDRLLDYFKANPEWVRPQQRLQRDGGDRSKKVSKISRSRAPILRLGYSDPAIGGGVIYVWFDALLNYITAIDWSEDEERFAQLWPAKVQLIGKEIARFHTIIWPAMLWALG